MGSSRHSSFEGDYGVVGRDRMTLSLTPDEQSVVTFDYDYSRMIGGLGPMSPQGSQRTLTVDLDQAYEDVVVGGVVVDGNSACLAGDERIVSSDERDECTENIVDISVALLGKSSDSDDGIEVSHVGGNETTAPLAGEGRRAVYETMAKHG